MALAVFSGANYYTRRGDFELDNGGYLVNGAGYYLKGLPIDPVTQNISGSVPQVLQISSQFLPAQQTSRINYQLNLPQLPKTAQYQASQASGSELLNASDFVSITPNQPAAVTGAGTVATGDAIGTVLSTGDTLEITVGGTTRSFTVVNSGGSSATQIDTSATTTVGDLITHLNSQFANATFSVNGDGRFTVAANALGDNVEIVTDDTTGTGGIGLGLATGTYSPTVSDALRLSTRVANVAAQDADDFIAQSISGGAITVYAESGAPTNVQMRWAKVTSTANGGSERWNLFMLTNSTATGGQTAWQRVGDDFTFGTNGSPNPPVEYTELSGININGVAVGNVRLQHGPTGLTQFSDPNGTAEVTTLNQNGYAAGSFVSAAVNDKGRVVVSYDNGRAARGGAGRDGELQCGQPAQAHGWRRVRRDIGVGRAHPQR
jgi:flagellar hook protein FlgE